MEKLHDFMNHVAHDKKGIIYLVVVLLLGTAFWYFYTDPQQTEVANITSYEECVAAGYPVMESYPEQCAVPGGQTFTRQIEDEASPEAETEDDQDESQETADNDSSDTTTTATYTNETYGFSFEYPNSAGWTLTAADGEVEDNEQIVDVKYDCGPNCGFAFFMQLDSENPMTAEDWKDQFADNSVYSLASEEEIQLGSVYGTKLVFTPGDEEGIADIVHVVANPIAETYQIQINQNGATTEGVDITAVGLDILNSLSFNTTLTR